MNDKAIRRIPVRVWHRWRLFIRVAIFAILLHVGILIVLLWQYHTQQVESERESILDHVAATVLKPIYAAMCPIKSNNDAVVCPPISKIIVLNGRPTRPVQSVNSWRNVPAKIEYYNTTSLLSTYGTISECKTTSWRARLFAIYKHVFRDTMAKYPNDLGFLFFEDDAVLTSFELLKEEACMAEQHQLSFFSFYKTSESCLYDYGTQGFYATREFLHRLIHTNTELSCRLGIDMIIASVGPWYASTKNIIQHNAQRFIPNEKTS
jgi:hypothetical protein